MELAIIDQFMIMLSTVKTVTAYLMTVFQHISRQSHSFSVQRHTKYVRKQVKKTDNMSLNDPITIV